MKLPHRRYFLYLAASAVALPGVSRIARTEAYPSQPVRIVVGFPPGGPSDIVARLIGQWLSERLGQPFIIEIRPGASTNIATEVAVRAPADGYTLLLVTPSAAINATLYDNLHFNFIHDIAPIATVMRAPYVLVINPSVPASTFPDFFTPKPIQARSRWRPRALALEATWPASCFKQQLASLCCTCLIAVLHPHSRTCSVDRSRSCSSPFRH